MTPTLPSSQQDSSTQPNVPLSFAGIVRVLQRFVRVVFWVVVCLLHLSMRQVAAWITRSRFPPRARAEILHRWSRNALRATGTIARVTGPVPSGGVVVANHLSYLDILLMSAAAPVVFVSKKEVGSYPLIGQAANLAGTILLDRDRSFAKQDVAGEMDETLQSGACVAFFPEGTTSDGRQLLRFRAALFAAPIRLGCPVQTAAFRYTVRGGGDAAELVSFWKDHVLIPHLLRLLMLPGVDATLEFGESFVPQPGKQPGASRAAANRAHSLVRAMLVKMGSLDEGSPETSEQSQTGTITSVRS